MKSINLMINTIVTFNIKEDRIVKDLGNIFSETPETAFAAYSDIVNCLLSTGTSLGEYFRQLLLYAENPVAEQYINSGNSLAKSAVECDILLIKEIAGVKASEIKNFLFEKFNETFIILAPEFSSGSFDFDGEYFIEHIKNNGSGIYAKYKAFTFSEKILHPVINFDTITLADLKKYEVQRQQIVDNTRFFIKGLPTNNILLYGDRGTGKSSTVKAMLNEFDALRIIQIDKKDIVNILSIYEMVQNVPLKFILFIDDLTFAEDDEDFGVLKQALDGSLAVRPSNVVIYATTNRRHIIKETSSARNGDDLHRSDAIDDSVSLSDRFGLYITFTAPNKSLFLEIVEQIAQDRGIKMNLEELCIGAERFALKKGNRSPRIAKQYIDIIYAEENSGD